MADTKKMREMTKDLAEDPERTPEGSGGLAWEPGGGETTAGASQNQGMSDQPLDAQMAQQAHQPAQGSDGGHASGERADRDQGSAEHAGEDS